jgi:capsular exopolysaccharide synthesis family protein
MDAPSTPLDPFAVWRSIRKHWITALASAAAVSLSVAFYTLGQPKVYQAAGTLVFDPNPPRPLGKDVDTVVALGAGDFWNNQEYYATQYKIIHSMRVARAVVARLSLDHDAAFLQNLPPGAKVPPKTGTPEQAAAIVQARLAVEPVRESRLAIVRFEDTDPARAQLVLSTLLETYVELNLDDALASTGAAVEWLRGQLDKLKGDLESSEMALHEYKLKNNILSVQFDDQSNILREEIKQLSDALTATRTKREEIAARRGELARVRSDDPMSLPASELLQSPVLQQLRSVYAEATRDREALAAAGKGDLHPEVAAADARVAQSRAALLAEVRNIQAALDGDFAAISRQEGGLAGLVDKAKKQALDLNLLEIEYNRLRRSKDNNEKLYELILERTKENDLARMLRVNNIRVLDAPLRPIAPVRPRVTLNIAFGVLFGMLAGVIAAVVRSALDRTLKTPDDVEQELRVNFLGLVPEIDEQTIRVEYEKRRRRRRRGGGADAPARRELIVHDHPMSRVAEAARAVRTNLLFMAPDNPYRALLVTSAGPSEGKTTVACCIAVAMAQAGQRVLLVDCDLRRPRLHRVFKRTNDFGLTNALLDSSVLDDARLPTEVPNLSVLPSGPIPPNPSEILHSARFAALLETLKGRYDRVILDSPPVAAVTDATVLSTQVDGTVVVARAFATRKEIARQAVRSLVDVGATVAGAVLNAVDFERYEYKYYYSYYRQDGYYASEGKPTPPTDDRPSRPSAAA